MSSLAEQHLDGPRLVHGALTYDYIYGHLAQQTATKLGLARFNAHSLPPHPPQTPAAWSRRLYRSDSALHVRGRGVRPRAVSLQIESYRYSGPNGGAREYAKPKRLSGWQGPELFVQQSKSLFL